MNLYAITSTLSAAIEASLAAAEDGTPTDELDAILAELDGHLDERAEAYACAITELVARAGARNDEARRMRALAEADANLASRLTDRLRDAMVVAGRQRIDTERFRLAVVTDGGLAPLAIDEGSMRDWPESCIATRRVPDRTAIRAALERGEPVPGCSLLPRGRSLRIR